MTGSKRPSLGDRVVAWLADRRLEAALKHVRGRVIDFGCGDNRLVRTYGNGIGVDILQWGNVDLVVEDASELPFDDASFDAATFVACLNHIPNREEALDEVHRILTPGGRVIVTMIPPGLSAFWHWIIRPWDPDQHGRHLHEGEVWGITNREMRRLLQRHGFRVELHERFDFGLNNLFVARKL
jgi:SAM-dependent methyltransferase